MSQLSFRQQLEQHNNPQEVRERLADEKYNQRHATIAQEYLDSLERNEEAASAARAEAREEENLSISRKALSNSERANKIAISAMLLSVVTAIIVADIQFISEKST